MTIRDAVGKDSEALAEIYGYYVKNTAVTFDYDAPTAAEFERNIAATQAKYPFLVAEEGDRILGFACAGVFKNKAAYARAAETTIYLHPGARGKGIGAQLLAALEDALRRRNFLNAYACIAFTEKEDDTLTNASMRFHERMGYRLCGTFRQCGYKFGRWYDMIWMEKMLGAHEEKTAPLPAQEKTPSE